MYDGSLRTRSPWQALVTFQQMIVLANKQGEVDMTAEALSFRTGIPIDIIRAGIEALEQPDTESRTDAEGGRRIVRVDDGRSWGWRIVNYAVYREMRSAEERREYMRLHMAAKRARKRNGDGVTRNVSDVDSELAPVSNVSQGSKQEADVEVHVIDDSVQIAVWCNGAIAERWGEQPSALTSGASAGLVDELRIAEVPLSVAQASIYEQCRASKQSKPPKSPNYFKSGILAMWASEQAKGALAKHGPGVPAKQEDALDRWAREAMAREAANV